ncbi:ShlB/FhaC/HecB family hemolysin secretion/activation protein [uncultured Zhongshania sp.]|uniref:ShlB/FhaC/HecB family hemolysin secretion/activation protein n=1 Tax=uncultured Zhongshania sp. TaxID=1642288 RepID=UPI0025F46E1E|nr:ShlB/FhaC/HecB family hemolysin secretion/activation protein [uncultured Zhongshania sp.]
MAIDLPPVIPPQLATPAQVSAYSAVSNTAISSVINGTNVRVLGNRYLADADVQDLLGSAKTPAEGIINLTKRYYQSGHLLVRIRYAREGDGVVVFVEQLTLADILVDADIKPFFEELVGDTDLSISEFDRARILANLKAERGGYQYSMSYQEAGNDAVALVMTKTAVENYDSTDYILEANNKGSRFLGRYFGLAGIKHRFEGGTELSVAYQTAFTDLGESRDGENLDQFSLSIDRPFTSGLYGVDLSYVEYSRDPKFAQVQQQGLCLLGLLGCSTTTVMTTVSLDAEILQAAFHGEQILFSDLESRISLTERLSHTDSTIQQAGANGKLLEETYQVVDIGLKYQKVRYQTEEIAAAQLNVGLNFLAGYGDGGTLDNYAEYQAAFMAQNPGVAAPDVVPSARTAEFIALQPSARYLMRVAEDTLLSFSANGQFTDEQVPQQQQFVLGGMNTLSAYLPGVLIGDEGYYINASLEKTFTWNEYKISPSVFAEYGASWFNNTNSELGDTQSIADAGVKLRIEFSEYLFTEFVAALPVHDDVINSSELDSLEADFFWRVHLSF